MARFCIFVIAAVIRLTCAGANSTNWTPAGFVEVRAYLYNLKGEQSTPILKQGKLSATAWNPKGEELSKSQIAAVQKAVADYHPDALSVGARCYRPRHAFVYYDAKHKPVGFVEICFSCWRYRASPEHSGQVDFEALKKLFTDLKIPLFDNHDSYLSLKKRTKG